MAPVCRPGERAYCIPAPTPQGLTPEGRFRFQQDTRNRVYVINPSPQVLSTFPEGAAVRAEDWPRIRSTLGSAGYVLDTRRNAYVKAQK